METEPVGVGDIVEVPPGVDPVCTTRYRVRVDQVNVHGVSADGALVAWYTTTTARSPEVVYVRDDQAAAEAQYDLGEHWVTLGEDFTDGHPSSWTELHRKPGRLVRLIPTDQPPHPRQPGESKEVYTP